MIGLPQVRISELRFQVAKQDGADISGQSHFGMPAIDRSDRRTRRHGLSFCCHGCLPHGSGASFQSSLHPQGRALASCRRLKQAFAIRARRRKTAKARMKAHERVNTDHGRAPLTTGALHGTARHGKSTIA
ncbi:hypothetical protein ABT142_33690 [Streptomyces sp. NPDC001857]|uniref:hypothetical protein n=1 Tax=unclassified Streptomyces TaxID=2593676 RepID=UPI00331BA2ED